MSVWAIPTLVSIGLLVGLIAFALWRRPPRGLFPPLLAGLLACLLFALGNLVFAIGDPRLHRVGLTLTYGGTIALGPAWLLLSLNFAAQQGVPFRVSLSRWRFAPAALAALLFAAFLTNPWHGLFLTAHPGSRSEYHALWWAHAVSGYLLLLVSCGLVLATARRVEDSGPRSRALLLAAAIAGPTLGNAVYVFSPSPLPFDPGAPALVASCALVIAGIYRRQLFALSPVALARILDRESDARILVNRAGVILYANPAAEELLGKHTTQVGSPLFPALASRLRNPVSPRRPVSVEDLADLARTDVPGGRLYHFGPDGRGWLRVEATRVPSRRESSAAVSLLLRDETALHTAMDAIEEQASVLEATLAATNEGLLVTEGDGTVRYFNARWREMLSIPESFQPGGHVDRLREIVIDQIADLETVDRQVERTREDEARETLDEFALRDGRILEAASQPLRRDGEIRGRLWRVRDITEQRRSEAAVRHAQKLESLGVMAGGIAHDFNNLLAVVMGNASLALEEAQPEGVAGACLQDVIKAAERAGALTEQLLAYAGRTELVAEEVDVSQVVRDVADLLSLSLPKGVEVRYELSDSLPGVMGDASQLRQILMNLVMNAAESIGEGGGIVRVETRYALLGRGSPREEYHGDLEPGPKVMLRVSDTGCGMAEETRSQIFDPFFSTKFAGRGLGLAATLGIVKSHRGALRVDSSPGKGSIFTVLLPCLEEPARAATPRDPGGSPWVGEGTILVVDDDEAVRIAATRILRSTGLSVLAASDGGEAIRIYRERGASIDAVLLDLTMPQMSGERAWRALRALDPSVRILLLSGYPEREATDRLAGEKGVFFVRKPYEKRTLVERLREALEA